MTQTQQKTRVGIVALHWQRLLSVFVAIMFTMTSLHSEVLANESTPTAAEPSKPKRTRIYTLETVELRGTTRITKDELVAELNLVPGTPLDDDLVMTTRSHILGMGLFKSAILLMRKGSVQGKARLIIEVEDDDGVVGDWAIGGELKVVASETNAQAVKSSTSPMDYRVGLISRNMFLARHRGSFFVDFDSEGQFQEGQIAYGLPRFSLEDVQFDAEVAAQSPLTRYLDTLGFGQRAQGLWSQPLSENTEFAYGPAMYINEGPRFAVPGFPKSVVGPKVEVSKETRLRGFFPGDGYHVGANLLFVPTKNDFSVLELAMAQTYSMWNYAFFTADFKALLLGGTGYTFRSEGRVDVPLGWAKKGEDQAGLFLRMRAGRDRIDQTDLFGSAAILGVRYHSSGFIAEISLKVTRSPDQLAPSELKGGGTP